MPYWSGESRTHQDNCVLQGTFGNSWRPFGLSQLGRATDMYLVKAGDASTYT